jgi:hypothetical protein
MPTIYEQLRADIVTAVKARDSATATALRSADAAVQRASMDLSKPIDDALAIGTIRKGVKNLADAKLEFERGGRADLVAANDVEIKLLEKYLPKAVDGERLDAMVIDAIRESGAQSRKDMGKVMGILKQKPEASLIDFSAASKLIQVRLP